MTDCLERECPKTLTGLHEWQEEVEYNNPVRDVFNNDIEYPVCKFCGLIDNSDE
jgi:hypothetical protein